MAHDNTYTVPYRRKREGRTDYHARMRLLKGQVPRLVVRKSLKHLRLQLVDYSPTGDNVLVEAHTAELTKSGWKGGTGGTPAAYLCGLLLAKKAKAAKIAQATPDLGRYLSVKGAVLYAALKGVVDGGLQVPLAPEVVPAEDRLSGKSIAQWAAHLHKSSPDHYKRQFSGMLARGLEPEHLPEHVTSIKKALMGA
jgi:large subunit ribosomal protein L18